MTEPDCPSIRVKMTDSHARKADLSDSLLSVIVCLLSVESFEVLRRLTITKTKKTKQKLEKTWKEFYKTYDNLM